MKIEIRKYIAQAYHRWHDFAAYHASQQNLSDHTDDVLHEVLLSVILMPEQKITRLFNAQGGDYRELDFFVLKMIRLNFSSETAPYRNKFKPLQKNQKITVNEHLLPDQDYDDEIQDTAGRQFKQWELIRIVGEALELTKAERELFTHNILCHESGTSLLGDELTKKKIYEIIPDLKKTIHQIIYDNGFTSVKPSNLSARAQNLARQFKKKYMLGLINPGTPIEKFKIFDIMKKQVFFKDDYNICELSRSLNKAANALQSIVQAFTAIGIEITDIKDIAGMIDTQGTQRNLRLENLETFVFNRLFPDTPAGLKRDLYRGLVELPDLTAVIQSFEPLNDYYGGYQISDAIHFTAYNIEGGQVKIVDLEKEKLETRFVEVAETKEEIDRLEAVNMLCESLNNLVKHAEDHPANYIIPGVTSFDEIAGKFIPGRIFVKQGAKTSDVVLGNLKKAESLKSAPVLHDVIPVGATDDEVGAAMAKRRNEASSRRNLL
jgi:hypothetical protein